jgi:hypothetical protein
LLDRYQDRSDEAGRLPRRLQRARASLWVGLVEHGVEATNNRAERALRFGVLWRKGSHGTASAKGNRWRERRWSLRQTCRQLGQSTFGVLVDAVTSLFCGRQPDLSWLYCTPPLSLPPVNAYLFFPTILLVLLRGILWALDTTFRAINDAIDRHTQRQRLLKVLRVSFGQHVCFSACHFQDYTEGMHPFMDPTLTRLKQESHDFLKRIDLKLTPYGRTMVQRRIP